MLSVVLRTVLVVRHRSVCAVLAIRVIVLHGTSFMKQKPWAMSAGIMAAGAMTAGTMAAGVKAAGVKAAGMLATTTTTGRAMVAAGMLAKVGLTTASQAVAEIGLAKMIGTMGIGLAPVDPIGVATKTGATTPVGPIGNMATTIGATTTRRT